MLATAPHAGAATDQKTRFYVLDNFYLQNGSQVSRIHDFFSQTLLPVMAKFHSGPKIFLEALVAPHMPQVALILGVRSPEEIWSVATKIHQQPEMVKGMEKWESDAEPPYLHCSAALLEATDYSPEIVPLEPPPKAPRIFELRTYHSPTARQLCALHERFAGPEIRIFHRSGVHPVLYSSTVFGANRPNLTYVIPFDSLAAREKAWAAFGADPEWVKVRKESIEKHGQISSVIQIALFRATAYSPIR